jgi:NADH:ubiquinone oxidoreductase subunit K
MITHGDTHSHVKTIIAFLIFLLAAAIFFIFYANQDAILQGNWQLFMTLAVVGAALLVGLLFLVSNSDTRGKTKNVRVSKPAKVKAKSSKKKRK